MPALLAKADELARTLMMGGHGRRRAGNGSEFWQYRPAQAGDPARSIDWRRSGQSDGFFVREQEWQAAQSVHFWCDQSASMQFSSLKDQVSKMDRAALLTLALSILLMNGGERVALDGMGRPPGNGAQQLRRIAQVLCDTQSDEFGVADGADYLPQSRAVLMSDFLGPMEAIERVVGAAADRGIFGVLFQILDPVEETFPFQGRTVFTSMGGGLSHETLRAGDLKARYLDRLAERKDELQNLARQAGWRYECHHTDTPVQVALVWLFQALDGGAN
ncbi:DUF58 domain-containing protein [Pacificibacter marinus]|uniref:DUF58 domain-containing protein n=1 Tax=Pacificibacter marinus TaxID=658057 RepID=UPI001C06CCC4|nr:DUF58 domain-containing protein [Pacificibacter marinus]MBU2865947.1 DUF58 domain-containing protein [Pacificibacter marinus]